MARDHFTRYEMCPPAPLHRPHVPVPPGHHLMPPMHRPGVAPGFEVTSGLGGGSSGPPPPMPIPIPPEYKKRKTASYHGGTDDDDDTGDDARSTRTAPDKKQNHSEIEKRRRDKMNTYITELSSLVPMCGAMARKLDKLTVLRMAVQHLRAIRGTLSACPLSARPRPAYLSEQEVNELILQAAIASCFVLVLSCDRGRLLYVSTSVTRILHYEQGELLGQTLFDILHPKDVAKVKEQLSSSDLSPRERLIDAKTMLPVKTEMGGSGGAGASRFCPGARRSFFCRIKCKNRSGNGSNAGSGYGSNAGSGYVSNPGSGSASGSLCNSDCNIKDEVDAPGLKRRKHAPSERRYTVVQFTGYLKAWAPGDISESSGCGEEGAINEEEACNMSCLVAVCRTLADMVPSSSNMPTETVDEMRRLHFISRHATDGKFLFVDQRVTPSLGFLPQELLSTSLYEYVANTDLRFVAKAHKAALLCQLPQKTQPYSFRRKDGTYARIQTHFKPFKNPWTKDVESLVAKNMLVLEVETQQPQQEAQAFYFMSQEDDLDMQRLINSQMELHKIGAAIAEEALRRTGCTPDRSPDLTPDLSQDLLQDAFAQQACAMAEAEGHPSILSEGSGGESVPQYLHVRNNVSLAQAASPPNPEAIQMESPPLLPPLSHDGNDEAAMAVIMSLLEADAGLGGPVDFSGLPWPLP